MNNQISFWQELKGRYRSAWCPAFEGYFWGYIVLFAIINVLFTILFSESFDIKMISASISTYFFGLIAASSIEINLSLSTKNKASFSIYSGVFYSIGFLLLIFTIKLPTYWSLIPAVIGFSLSLFMWIVGNSDNPKLNDETYREKVEQSRTRVNQGAQEFMNQIKEDEK